MADFGNYPNMGHCVFNNASLSVQQILNGLEEVETPRHAREMVEGLNRDELRRYKEMMDLAQCLQHELERIDDLDLQYECDEELEDEMD